MQAAAICADRRTDRHDERSRLFVFVRSCLKTLYTSKVFVVGDMPVGCINFSIFNHYLFLELPLLTSQMSANNDRQIYTHLCCGVLCFIAYVHLLSNALNNSDYTTSNSMIS